MRRVCAPKGHPRLADVPQNQRVLLYSKPGTAKEASAGGAIPEEFAWRGLEVHPRAWDLLSIALSIVAADTSITRANSSDGWTRQIGLDVAVADEPFWSRQAPLLSRQLRFLTTDIWDLNFLPGGSKPERPESPEAPPANSVSLLSGGLDSMIGAIDLVARGRARPMAVSQIAAGDKEKQAFLARTIGGGLYHLQLNHNVRTPADTERSQRARSFLFLTYGVLAATTLSAHHEGKTVPLYVCENGFISINPPLTGARLGSLSTRTTHPYFLRMFQNLIDGASLHVALENPYRFKTKGEMMRECVDQDFLARYAHETTSCGRFARHGFQHCGRCIPCLIRRAAFQASGLTDRTGYKYEDLSKPDKNHAGYDDVRSALMGIEEADQEGISKWAGPILSSALIPEFDAHRRTVERGLAELAAFLQSAGAR